MASESYKECDACGADCDLFNFQREGEPCWGEVIVVDEISSDDDYGWIHACEGHADCYYNEPYKLEIKSI